MGVRKRQEGKREDQEETRGKAGRTGGDKRKSGKTRRR
jgi:hypothetical protein